MKPLFPYYGSKWNAARRYPAPTGRVVEPFAGSAGYSLFYGADDVLLIDADPIIVGVWDYLIKASDADISSLPEMLEAGDCVDNYNVEQEAKWLIGFWLNRGSASPKKTRTAYSARTDRAQLNWGTKAKERILTERVGVRNWKVRLGDYTQAGGVATWFVDPPYVDKGKYYRTRFDRYDSLAEWCADREGLAIVCEGPGAKWLPFRHIGSLKSSKGRADEFVWFGGSSAEAKLLRLGQELDALRDQL